MATALETHCRACCNQGKDCVSWTWPLRSPEASPVQPRSGEETWRRALIWAWQLVGKPRGHTGRPWRVALSNWRTGPACSPTQRGRGLQSPEPQATIWTWEEAAPSAWLVPGAPYGRLPFLSGRPLAGAHTADFPSAPLTWTPAWLGLWSCLHWFGVSLPTHQITPSRPRRSWSWAVNPETMGFPRDCGEWARRVGPPSPLCRLEVGLNRGTSRLLRRGLVVVRGRSRGKRFPEAGPMPGRVTPHTYLAQWWRPQVLAPRPLGLACWREPRRGQTRTGRRRSLRRPWEPACIRFLSRWSLGSVLLLGPPAPPLGDGS